MKGFGSDNHSGIHPVMLQAMIDGNSDHVPSYGTDRYSEKTAVQFQDLFASPVDTYFVYNGTAANVLSLQAAMERFESVLCSDVSHLHIDECGAPEFFAGKIQTLPSKNGKIIFSEIEKYLIRKGDQHYSQPRVISITQPTELGTCYSLDEIQEISLLAKKHGLFLHIDGARISNAIHYLNTTFKTMVTDKGVDIVSFGGTKNGFAFGEAVVILNKELKKDFKFIRKQAAQLPSKSRFIAQQFSAYLKDETYLKIAAHSLKMAELLHHELAKVCLLTDLIKITHPRQSNAVFAILPKKMIKALRENFFFYVWNESTTECRLMTSWDTKPEEIHEFILQLKTLI